jgi:DNA repair exonuclease SbcCD ATPase subunit
MSFWEKALSEKGVIKYVIRNILSYFNERINYYLSYLTDHTFSLEFDDELSENITIGDTITHYISLSGGERRKINLAVMMALKDLLLLSDTDHPDLLFFDEVAENIDEQGIQGLYNLLLDLKKTRQIFVITHNKNLKTLLDSSKRITVEKKKGISYIWHK